MKTATTARPRPVFRRSAVSFGATPAATESRDGWTVVLRYQGERGHPGPFIVDLSHRRRWDCQDSRIATHRPMQLPIPERLGGVGVHDPFVVARMNRTQASIWHLGKAPPPLARSGPGATPLAGPPWPGLPEPGDPTLTETTDGHAMLAFVGPGVPGILEGLTSLDLFDPARPTPHLTQGPVLRVPCQIVTFARDLVVMTLARGYGETFASAALASGRALGLSPGGEEVFSARWGRGGG